MINNNQIKFEKIIEIFKEKSWKPTNSRIGNLNTNKLKKSAVLVPFVFHKNEIALLYTLRSSTLDRHSGQVAFPGGLIENTDLTPIEAALRETEEEIGIEKTKIQIVGQLRPFNSKTGYFIYPIIGIITSLQNMFNNKKEVERIFCIPISWLSDPDHSRKKKYITSENRVRILWFFNQYEGEILWGITAKITHDIIQLI